MIHLLYEVFTNLLMRRCHDQFKVDRLQIVVVAKKYLCCNCSSVAGMPKMCAIPQLVSAPLNPIPTAEHFRRSHPQCEHSYGQHIYMREENNAK